MSRYTKKKIPLGLISYFIVAKIKLTDTLYDELPLLVTLTNYFEGLSKRYIYPSGKTTWAIHLDEEDTHLDFRGLVLKLRSVFREENPPQRLYASWRGEYFWRSEYLSDAKNKLFLKKCQTCQTFYICGHPLSRYCSEECSPATKISKETKKQYNSKYYRKKRKAQLGSRNCDFCGQEFYPQRATKQFCSDKCRKAKSRQRQRDQK